MADRQHDAGCKSEGAEVTDDLVKRLREHAIHLDAWGKEAIHDANIIEEAADRIEKLEAALDEAAFSQTLFDAVVGQRNKATDRIEKLEAALREIAAGYETEWSTSTIGNMLDVAQILSERISIARKALEGKDGT